ncbi:MAG: glucosamine-6-phosphate deaminase [Anaerolineae bacterium]|nr:glucosamine-6-phosphate deaminase [Anaerolineae bacterium]
MTIQPLWTRQYDQLPVSVYESNAAMAEAAAHDMCALLQSALSERGEANLILATGNSQLTFLHTLKQIDGIDWSAIRVFHMDEYIGIDPDHRASFPLFLRMHFLDGVKPRAFYPVPGGADDVEAACREYAALLRTHPADAVALGIGENGHIAFNEPPAPFDDPEWVKVVDLDDVSRMQQVKEGHFDRLDDVPKQAITLTIPALLAAKRMLCLVPETRKADIVRACLLEPIDPMRPASILREQDHARLYLDRESAAKLDQP